ncbi:unnamed protein product [Penicillium pancosmium]
MNSSRLFPNMSLFSTPQARWSEPELSIDSYRGMKKGKLHCWDATGPARDAFEQVRQQVIDRLNGARIQVPSSSMIMVDVFMIGKDQAKSRPYIMFSCRHRESRKAAVTAIKESNILDQCPPGMLLGDWDYPPHLINVRPLASSGVKSSIVINAVELDDEATKSYRCRAYPVLDLKSGKIRALRLAIQNESTSSGSPCMATIGSVIKLHGRKYYLVPAHVFNATIPDVMSEEMSLSEDSECDIGEFDSDDESFSDGQDEADFMSRHSASAESSDIEEEWDLDSEETMSDGESTQYFDERREQPPSTAMASAKACPSAADMILFSSNHHAFSLARPPRLSSECFDYCLIDSEMDEESISTDLPVLSKDTIGQLNGRSVNVTAITCSGITLRGILSGRKSCIRLPNATNFVEVLSAQFEDSLQPGVCGSIVRDANTGKIYGHLVAGDTESQFAFIVQAADVLDDAMTRLPETEAVLTNDKQTPALSSVSHEPLVESTAQYNDAYWFGQSPSIFHVEETLASDTSLDGRSVGDSCSLDISLDGLSLIDDGCDPLLGDTWHVSSSHCFRKRSLQEPVTDSVDSTKKRRIDLEEVRNDPCAQPEDFGESRQAITGLNHPGSHFGLSIEDVVNAFGCSTFISRAIPQSSPRWDLDLIPQNYEMTQNPNCGMSPRSLRASSPTYLESTMQPPWYQYGKSLPPHDRRNHHRILEEWRHISDALKSLHEQPQQTFARLQGEHDFLTRNTVTPPVSLTSAEWIPLTTFGYGDEVLVDSGRHRESQAHVSNSGHDNDDSHVYISYTWDKTKLFDCHLCSRDKSNRHIFTGGLKRHIMNKHHSQYEYDYPHGSDPCHRRDKIREHFRSRSASNRHEYGSYCYYHCSAKSLRSRLGPDIVTELLRLRSRFLNDACVISNSSSNALLSGRSTTIRYCAPSWLASSLNGLRLWDSCAKLGKNITLHEISIAPSRDPSRMAFAFLTKQAPSPFPYIAFLHGIDCEIRLDPDQQTMLGGILIPRSVNESTKEIKVPICRNGGFVQVIHRDELISSKSAVRAALDVNTPHSRLPGS